MNNIYKMIWFTYPNYFKVFYTVNDRKVFTMNPKISTKKCVRLWNNPKCM